MRKPPHPAVARAVDAPVVYAPAGRDRAAVVARSILSIVHTAQCRWLAGDTVSFTNAHATITALLREEFHDIARETRDDIRLRDE